MKLYLIISIDTECDKDSHWNIPRPMTFFNISRDLPARLHPLFISAGFAPTYLLSPEVIKDADCVETLVSLMGKKELGTHLHSEFIDPDSDPFAHGTFVFQGDLPRFVELRKLENLTALFERVFGYRPTSFRAGRFGLGPHTLASLSSLGYLVDSSIFPLRRVVMKTRTNNFLSSQLKPYFPDLSNFNKKSSRPSILEVPLTVHSAILRLPRIARVMVGSVKGLSAILLGRENTGIFSLRPSLLPSRSMKRVVERYLDYCDGDDQVFLNLMMHSNEIRPGASPSCQSEGEADLFVNQLDDLFTYLRSLGCKGMTLSESWFLLNGLEIPTDPKTYYTASLQLLQGKVPQTMNLKAVLEK